MVGWCEVRYGMVGEILDGSFGFFGFGMVGYFFSSLVDYKDRDDDDR